MQITPRSVQRLCQALAVLTFGVLASLDLNPTFAITPFFAVPLRDIHFAAGFTLTLLVYISFPRSRRADLTLFVGVWISLIAVLMGAVRLKMGSPAPPLINPMSVMEYAGVVAAYLPGYAERLRYLRRTQAFRGFGDIAASDRRRAARAAATRQLGENTYVQRGGVWVRRTEQSQAR